MENAIDQATAFIQGTGHQIELESIRSRTKEAIRDRVRQGRSAGGKCFGYTNVRKQDASGRGYTEVEIYEPEAIIVLRIFGEFAGGRGLKKIAVGLNNSGIPSPHAGKRGTGTWSPSCIRALLQNQRYQGLYVHGRTKRLGHGKKRPKLMSDEAPMVVEMPRWRIVDEQTWGVVQRRFQEQKHGGHGIGPATKHPLSGIARCGVCGGSIGVVRTKSGQTPTAAYACIFHKTRGDAVCTVRLAQRADVVEGAITKRLQQKVLEPEVLDLFVSRMRVEIEQEMAAPPVDTSRMEDDLRQLRTEQRNLVKLAAAGADEVPELARAMNERANQIRQLEADLAAAKRSPAMITEMADKMERLVRAKLEGLRAALQGDREGTREVFRALFPDGLKFKPATGANGRQVFEITGTAKLGEVANCVVTPPGIEPGFREGAQAGAGTENDDMSLACASGGAESSAQVRALRAAFGSKVANLLRRALVSWEKAPDGELLVRSLRALLGDLEAATGRTSRAGHWPADPPSS